MYQGGLRVHFPFGSSLLNALLATKFDSILIPFLHWLVPQGYFCQIVRIIVHVMQSIGLSRIQ